MAAPHRLCACVQATPSLHSVAVSDLMSRCAKCNGLGYDHLTLEELGAEGDASAVPDKVGEQREAPRPAQASGYVPTAQVKAIVSEYWRCRRCRKVYWCVCVGNRGLPF